MTGPKCECSLWGCWRTVLAAWLAAAFNLLVLMILTLFVLPAIRASVEQLRGEVAEAYRQAEAKAKADHGDYIGMHRRTQEMLERVLRRLEKIEGEGEAE